MHGVVLSRCMQSGGSAAVRMQMVGIEREREKSVDLIGKGGGGQGLQKKLVGLFTEGEGKKGLSYPLLISHADHLNFVGGGKIMSHLSLSLLDRNDGKASSRK